MARRGSSRSSGRAPARTVDHLDGLWRLHRWLEPPTRPAPEPVALDVALVAAVAASHVADHELVPWRYHVASHLAAAGVAVGGALAAGATITDLGLRPDRMADGARHGLAIGAAMSVGIAVAALNPASRAWFVDERVLDISPAEVAGRSLVRIPFGTAVYEEVVFRGVLLGLALRRLPPLPAVAATSALFGLWHVLPTLRDHGANDLTAGQPRHHAVAGAVALTTVAGFGFGFQRLRTNSVVTPIVTHAVGNAVVFATAAWIGRHERRARAARRRAALVEDRPAIDGSS
jgi:membrane protease YdiL (CAAX protease family)